MDGWFGKVSIGGAASTTTTTDGGHGDDNVDFAFDPKQLSAGCFTSDAGRR